MAAIDSSIYNTITIESFTGNSVDIRMGVVSIDFFEDVFCPAVSARIAVMTSGGSLKDEQGVESLLYEALKIRGGEPIRIYIEANTSQNKPLDYLNKPMYVRGVSGLIREGNKEFFQMHCISREGYEDTQIILQKRYTKDSRLDQHVKTIIEESFIDPGKVTVDTTINQMGFCGNNEHPFAAITRLASKAVPQIGGSQQTGNAASAGFFFWQTTEGFNFRSVDALVKEKVSASYFASDVNYNTYHLNQKQTFSLLTRKFSHIILRETMICSSQSKREHMLRREGSLIQSRRRLVLR